MLKWAEKEDTTIAIGAEHPENPELQNGFLISRQY